MTVLFVGRCVRTGRRQLIQKGFSPEGSIPVVVEKTDDCVSEDIQVIPIIRFEKDDRTAGLYLNPYGIWIVQQVEMTNLPNSDNTCVILRWDYEAERFECLDDALDWIEERFKDVDVFNQVEAALQPIDVEVSRWFNQIHRLHQRSPEPEE